MKYTIITTIVTKLGQLKLLQNCQQLRRGKNQLVQVHAIFFTVRTLAHSGLGLNGPFLSYQVPPPAPSLLHLLRGLRTSHTHVCSAFEGGTLEMGKWKSYMLSIFCVSDKRFS